MNDQQVVFGDDLEPGNQYVMKTWAYRSSGNFRDTRLVRFVAYCSPAGILTKDSFDMKDLAPGKGQTCILLADNGEIIVLSVLHDHHIWVTSDDDRVTFSAAP